MKLAPASHLCGSKILNDGDLVPCSDSDSNSSNIRDNFDLRLMHAVVISLRNTKLYGTQEMNHARGREIIKCLKKRSSVVISLTRVSRLPDREI